MDSFTVYGDFEKFICKPIADILGEGNHDLNQTNNLLRNYCNEVKGEIRKNCQAHNSSGETDYYLFTIKSKLDSLYSDLFINESDGTFNLTKYYKADLDNVVELTAINIIRHKLSDILKFANNFPVSQGKQYKKSSGKTKDDQEKKYFSLKTIPGISEEDLTLALNALKALPFRTVGPDTDAERFIKCFSGEKVDNKVKWERTNVLFYFVTCLANKNLFESSNTRIWELSSLCFADKNNNKLTAKQLGKTRPPKSKPKRDCIKRIADSLQPPKDGSIKKTVVEF